MEQTDEKQLIIYTDGACFRNPGPGAWAAILIYGDSRKEISQGFRRTTNNRMEIMAILEALKTIKWRTGLKVKLYSDSEYCINTLTKGWLWSWKKNNWKRKAGEVKNIDLWDEMANLILGRNIDFIHVYGHVGIEENENCDKLAKAAASASDLDIDVKYERSAR
ncbi:MAG: ribonuclease HI [Candidatus Kapabacteria bacterium]|nr:ribonuclease HI [Candidatus Kapabacteria bacterium]